MVRVRIVASAFAIVLLLCILLWLWWMRSPELTAAMRGERLARDQGCFGCHGPGGRGGVPDPATPSGSMPGWDPIAAATYASSVEDIVDWIRTGTRKNDPAPAPTLVKMPAYPGLTDREVADLVAYFKAVAHWTPEIPEAAYQGRAAAARLGCLGCHGPSGMGGTPNPGSLVGHIPAWDGTEYGHLVQSEDELRQWILLGRPDRLWNDPLARHYLEAQTISMPAYRDHISDHDLERIVAYLRWLRANVAAK